MPHQNPPQRPPAHGYTVPSGLTPPAHHGPPALAELGTRFVARLIDNLIVGSVLGLALAPVMFVVFFSMADELPDPGSPGYDAAALDLFLRQMVIMIPFALASVIVHIAYESVMVRKSGATLGKKIMKLTIVRATDGSRLGWRPAIGRATGMQMLGLFPCVNWLDPLWALWDKPNRQTLHDKLARTIVVRTEPVPWATPAEFTEGAAGR